MFDVRRSSVFFSIRLAVFSGLRPRLGETTLKKLELNLSKATLHHPIRFKLLVQRLAGDTKAACGFAFIAAAGFKGV